MSPEQTRASPKLDHRCDLWALATIAYQMLTGHLPVDGSDAEEVMKNVCAGRIVPLRKRDPSMPLAVDAFFDRAFADRVDDRFEGAASLAQMFELACGGGTSGAMIPPSVPSIPEHTGNTATEFSSTLAGDALRAYGAKPTKLVLASATAIVALGVTVMGIRAAWQNAPSHPVASNAIALPSAAPSTSAIVRSSASVSSASFAQPAPATTDAWVAVLPMAAPTVATIATAAPSRRVAGEHGEHAAPVAPAVVPAPTRPKVAPPDEPAAAAPSARPLRAAREHQNVPAADRNDVF